MSQTTATELAQDLKARFQGEGATPLDLPILQPAGTLLDLYGEDIRARAYVTSDPLRGEQMLRPDFTVPVVQMHMTDGAEPARYTYAGPVFRKQEDDAARPSEYLQVGFEVFDRTAPEHADAEVFAQMARALSHLPVRAVTGDMSVLMAAVEGLETSQARKGALLRHVWRPERFRRLLDRFAMKTRPRSPQASDAPLVGKRSQVEIDTRLAALNADAELDPIGKEELESLGALLDLRAPLPDALTVLHQIAAHLPSIANAVACIERRITALAANGIDISRLEYDGSYGRRTMEYYDGFVFGFYADDLPGTPSLASGGRYDALTRRLGQGREIPAVGGVLRPALMLELEGAI